MAVGKVVCLARTESSVARDNVKSASALAASLPRRCVSPEFSRLAMNFSPTSVSIQLMTIVLAQCLQSKSLLFHLAMHSAFTSENWRPFRDEQPTVHARFPIERQLIRQ